MIVHKSDDGKHKYVAVFENGKKVRFGAVGYLDFTQHHSTDRRNAYILRHRNNEDWNDPYSAGALSRWILWEKPSLHEGISFFNHKFNV